MTGIAPYYSSYIVGQLAMLTEIPCLSRIRSLPSSFRVHWRVLNIDGFHHIGFFASTKYRFTVSAA